MKILLYLLKKGKIALNCHKNIWRGLVKKVVKTKQNQKWFVIISSFVAFPCIVAFIIYTLIDTAFKWVRPYWI